MFKLMINLSSFILIPEGLGILKLHKFHVDVHLWRHQGLPGDAWLIILVSRVTSNLSIMMDFHVTGMYELTSGLLLRFCYFFSNA